MRYRLVEKTIEFSSAFSGVTESVDVGGEGCDSFSCLAIIDVDTPSAKTFDSGKQATLIVQDLTYLADSRGVAGNGITIAYTAGGTAGAEVVTVVGTAISVSIDVTPVTGSSADQVKAAVDASVAASALISVTVSGTGVTVQAAAVATALATGADPEVNITDDEITIPSHGLTEGLKCQLTTTGTLPAGLSLATDYFVIVIDANTIQLAASLLLAQAGTAIDITNEGSNGAVNTITAVAVAGGSIKLQQSNDDVIWVDLGSATNITADANVLLEKDRPTTRYIRVSIALTAGHISADLQILAKGDRT